MFRIDNTTAVASIPVIPAVGTPGFFTNGNPVTAMPATVVDDWWANTIQEEILNVVVNAGLTPNKYDDTQLWQAINAILPTGGGGGEPDYDPFLPLTGGTIYQPLTTDPLQIVADYGYLARIVYSVTGVRAWAVGCDTAGNFEITDGTANAIRAYWASNGDFYQLRGLVANGNATFNGGSTTVHGAFINDGPNATIGSLYVTFSANVTNNLSAGGNLSANGTIGAGGNIYTDKDVIVNHTVFAQSLSIDQSATIGVNLTAKNYYIGTSGTMYLIDNGAGSILLNPNLVVAGNITSGATLTSGGNATFNGLLTTVHGSFVNDGASATIGTLYVNYSGNVTGNLGVGGNVNINNALSVGGAISSGGPLTCGGSMTVHGSFINDGTSATIGTLDVRYSASVANGLSVGGAISSGGPLTCGGNATFNGGSTTVHGSFVNDGASATIGTLDVTFSANITNNLGVGGAANINSNLFVGGNINLGGGLSTLGDLNVNSITLHGQLWMGGSGGVQGSLSIAGDMSCNYASVANGLHVGMSVGIAGACTVNGDGSMNNFTANGQSIAGLQFYSVGPCWASAFNLSSDLRTKENVEDLGGGQLDAIRSLRPITYNLIDSIVADRGNRHNGFLAQEILDTPLAHLVRQSTIPHARAPEGLLAIDFAGLLASAVGAIKELDERLAQLESARSE